MIQSIYSKNVRIIEAYIGREFYYRNTWFVFVKTESCYKDLYEGKEFYYKSCSVEKSDIYIFFMKQEL